MDTKKPVASAGGLFHFIHQELISIYAEQESRSIAYLLMEDLLAIPRIDILLDKPLAVIPDAAQVTFALNRLKQQEPIQYITGKSLFCERFFSVNPDVLIPRPETEELVCHILKSESGRKNLQVLDLCTGSGCIAISLALSLPDSKVEATDISAGALNVAQKNAGSLDAKVRFYLHDLLNHSANDLAEQYDVIVSNPPYVLDYEKLSMQANVLDYEPHLALFVPDNQPLLYYQAIARLGAQKLNKGGRLYLEVNSRFAGQTADLLSFGFSEVKMLTDLNNKLRFVTAQRN